jgi:hypothetical protein
VLHSLWYDEHGARRELYCPVAKVEAEHSFEDDETPRRSLCGRAR